MIEVLSAEGFQARAREKLLAYDIYQDEAEHLVSVLPRGRRNLSDAAWLASKDEGQKMLAAATLARLSVDLLTLAYSGGSNLTELRAFYPSLTEAWLIHEKLHVEYGRSPLGVVVQT